MQEVLNGLLQGKSSVTLPKRKEKGREGAETTVSVDDGRTRHSTSNTPQTKQREHPEPPKQAQKPELKTNVAPHNDDEATSKRAPSDLREELNKKRAGKRTTPPMEPREGKGKGDLNPSALRNSLS